MTLAAPLSRDRALSAAAAVGIPALLGWVLISGLAVRLPAVIEDGLAVFAVAPEPPPPPPARIEPNPVRDTRPEGEASPPNIRSRATQAVAPQPVVVIPLPPPPIVVAPKAGVGADASTGSAQVVGPGTGAGGVGDGTGSGGQGDGDGAGGSETPPMWRRGRMTDADFPASVAEAGISGTVEVSYLVQTNGRVTECDVTRSSGNAVLDTTTCRLIQRRYRFDPSRDERGRPIPARIIEKHSWMFERLPAEE